MNNSLNTILYVEDSPFVRAAAQIALETVGGFTLKMFETGEEAVQSGSAFKPDLILLDVMLPGMDGPSTFVALRKDPLMKDIPVIFMTGKDQPSEIQYYRDLGALDVIVKPFDPATLAEQVQNIWTRAQG